MALGNSARCSLREVNDQSATLVFKTSLLIDRGIGSRNIVSVSVSVLVVITTSTIMNTGMSLESLLFVNTSEAHVKNKGI